MAVLAIHEHQKVSIGSRFSEDPASPSITRAELRSITSLNKHYSYIGFPEPFEINSTYIKAKQYVGLVSLGSNCLEVLPKIDFENSRQCARLERLSLARMLEETRKLEVGVSRLGSVEVYDRGILEVFFGVFTESLQAAVRAGLIRNYVPRRELLPTLKGRWLVDQQLKRGPQHAHLFECSFDELTEDNPYNRLLKAALKIVASSSRVERTLRVARQLLFLLDEVQDFRNETPSLPRGRPTRPFDTCLDLAELFVRSSSPGVVYGGEASFALFFDMNKLFEEFVARRLMRLLPGRVLVQQPEKHLAFEDETGTYRFRMRPDLILTDTSGSFLEVIDTKWKQLDLGRPNYDVSSSDLYQVITYARQYGCRKVSLVYPATASAKGLISTLRIRETDLSVRLIALDLRNLAELEVQLRHFWAEQAS
jgi:5-methylcytosine-specific restriction enzyme subunit McrC